MASTLDHSRIELAQQAIDNLCRATASRKKNFTTALSCICKVNHPLLELVHQQRSGSKTIQYYRILGMEIVIRRLADGLLIFNVIFLDCPDPQPPSTPPPGRPSRRTFANDLAFLINVCSALWVHADDPCVERINAMTRCNAVDPMDLFISMKSERPYDTFQSEPISNDSFGASFGKVLADVGAFDLPMSFCISMRETLRSSIDDAAHDQRSALRLDPYVQELALNSLRKNWVFANPLGSTGMSLISLLGSSTDWKDCRTDGNLYDPDWLQLHRQYEKEVFFESFAASASAAGVQWPSERLEWDLAIGGKSSTLDRALMNLKFGKNGKQAFASTLPVQVVASLHRHLMMAGTKKVRNDFFAISWRSARSFAVLATLPTAATSAELRLPIVFTDQGSAIRQELRPYSIQDRRFAVDRSPHTDRKPTDSRPFIAGQENVVGSSTSVFIAWLTECSLKDAIDISRAARRRHAWMRPDFGIEGTVGAGAVLGEVNPSTGVMLSQVEPNSLRKNRERGYSSPVNGGGLAFRHDARHPATDVPKGLETSGPFLS